MFQIIALSNVSRGSSIHQLKSECCYYWEPETNPIRAGACLCTEKERGEPHDISASRWSTEPPPWGFAADRIGCPDGQRDISPYSLFRDPYNSDQLQRRQWGESMVGELVRRCQRQPFRYNPTWRGVRDGTVFEIVNSGGVYASTPTTLVSFDGADGEFPTAGLIADANGDLFGTTLRGGAYGIFGTVFKIVNSSRRLCKHANHPGQLRLYQRPGSNRRPDRRCQRQPLRYNPKWRGARLRHGLRDRQFRRRLCKHANHPGQLRLHPRRSAGSRPDRRCQRQPLQYDL